LGKRKKGTKVESFSPAQFWGGADGFLRRGERKMEKEVLRLEAMEMEAPNHP